jgi:hypothetical protein
MRVEVTAMKNFPSKRGSRLMRARSSARRSRPRIASMAPRYAGRPRSTSRFRTESEERRSPGLAHEGHEPHGQEPSLDRRAVARDGPQLLDVVADRDHEPPAVAELAFSGLTSSGAAVTTIASNGASGQPAQPFPAPTPP